MSSTCRLTHFVLLAFFAIVPSANAQVVNLYDVTFEDDFPGAFSPANVDFTFYGDQTSDSGAGDTPVVFTESVLETGGVGGSQAYQVTVDGTDALNYYYGGIGDLAMFFGPGNEAAGGVSGTNDPHNYEYTIDLRVEGAISAVPLRGEFVVFDYDYEATNGVDANGDGDMEDGYDTYITEFDFVANAEGFTTNTFRLDEGTPATTDVPNATEPLFSNDSTYVLRWFFGAGEFGFDNDNTMVFDNISVDFITPQPVPGDYNDDGEVNAADYTVWRDNLGQSISLPNEGDGVTTGQVTSEDYDFWVANFGSEGSSPSAVPEPTSVLLAALGLTLCSYRRPLR